MEYTREILDRSSGELVTVSMGEWRTITEVAEVHGIGPRKFRAVLQRLDFVQLEYKDNEWRHRLSPWVLERGWGQRLKRSRGTHQTPFDVISPDGQDWIALKVEAAIAELEAEVSPEMEAAGLALENFRKARNEYRAQFADRKNMPVDEMVAWLSDFFPRLSHQEIASILYVSRQLVSRLLRRRSSLLKSAKGKRGSAPGPTVISALAKAHSLRKETYYLSPQHPQKSRLHGDATKMDCSLSPLDTGAQDNEFTHQSNP
jgi:hypothetical protein